MRIPELRFLYPPGKKCAKIRLEECRYLFPSILGATYTAVAVRLDLTQDELTDSDRRYFLTSYQSLSTCDKADIVKMCAFNFPVLND